MDYKNAILILNVFACEYCNLSVYVNGRVVPDSEVLKRITTVALSSLTTATANPIHDA